MAQCESTDFLAGVIEGFYGQPWSPAERLELFNWMAQWGLNTYLYAPKDDLKHRALWRDSYSPSEAETLRELIGACKQRNLRFIYALSPGLDLHYSRHADLELLKRRFEQMQDLGCRDFSLLFDDIPDRMDPEDLKQWGSLASAQSHVANAIFKWIQEQCNGSLLLFCPTAYCGRMAERKLGGEDYLPTLGRELLPGVDVFWTGPEIVSQEITLGHVQELQEVLRRKPVIWDNLHANDYDARRFFCGPYAGRPPELRNAVNGLLVNPNNEFPLNFVPLRTMAQFVSCKGAWDSRKAYISAMREWLPHFATVGAPVALEDLILLGDCYYLPYEEGPEAEDLVERATALLTSVPAEWERQVVPFLQQVSRLRELCVRITELRERPLFYALRSRIWELREELELLNGYLGAKFKVGDPITCSSDSHLPGTFRGGMVARLQRLLVQQPDGTFSPVGGSVAGRTADATGLRTIPAA